MGFHLLVLAGGSGTRLWPLSRGAVPKHLLPLGPDGETLLRATVDRVGSLADVTWVVTAAAQAGGCAEALAGAAGDVRVMAEPVPRGTGPAIGLAVAEIAALDPQAVIASVHADAYIGDAAAYRAAIVAAAGWAAATDGLAAVGLEPTHAATGLGYIAVGSPVASAGWRTPGGAPAAGERAAAALLPANESAGFVEKPSRERAEQFVAGGQHLWNLGLFAWTASRLLAEIEVADPLLLASLREIAAVRSGGDDAAAADLYERLDSVAIEPLVFERTHRLTVVRASFAWSDLGSWADLAATLREGADEHGNVVSGDAVVVNSNNCLVESRGGRLIAVVGADDLVVVDTGDAVLVMPASASQEVKAVVERLRAARRDTLV